MSHTTHHRPFLQRLMFWGAICGSGPLSLVSINGTMSAQKYVNTLEHCLVPFLEDQPLSEAFVFMQDNAPSHKAHLTRNYLVANAVEVLQGWPPYSPDLNIIENMWAFLKRKIKQENINSKEVLITRVQQIWDTPEVKDMCARLASSMPSRIAKCVQNKGGFIKY
jgi:transposase